MISRNKYILYLQYILMAFHQIFISKLVQLLGLVLTGLKKKDQQKKNKEQKTKQNKTKQNKTKTKQKPRKKTTTKQFDHFNFTTCQNQYFTLV